MDELEDFRVNAKCHEIRVADGYEAVNLYGVKRIVCDEVGGVRIEFVPGGGLGLPQRKFRRVREAP